MTSSGAAAMAARSAGWMPWGERGGIGSMTCPRSSSGSLAATWSRSGSNR